MLMAEAYAKGLDERDELKSEKLALESELRHVRLLLAKVLKATEVVERVNPALYEHGYAAIAGNVGA